MYLSNAEVGPVGAEVAEFIDYPRTLAELVADEPAGSVGVPGTPGPSDDFQVPKRGYEYQLVASPELRMAESASRSCFREVMSSLVKTLRR